MRRAFRVHHDPAPRESVQLVIDFLPEGMRPIGDGWWEAHADVHEESVYYYRAVDPDGRVTRIDHGRPRRPLGESVIIDRWRPADPSRMARHSAFFKNGIGRHWPEARGASGLRLTLRLHEPSVEPGHRVAVVGSDPALGAWDTAHAERMTASPFPWWTLTIDLSNPEVAGEYSYLVVDGEGGVIHREAGRHPLPPCLTSTIVTDEAMEGLAGWRGTGVAIDFSDPGEGKPFAVSEFRDLAPLADWAAGCGISAIELPSVNDTLEEYDYGNPGTHHPVSVHALHPRHLDLSDLPGSDQLDLTPAGRQAEPDPDIERPGWAEAKLGSARMLFDMAPPDAAEEEFREANWSWLGPYAYWRVLRGRFGVPASQAWGPDHHFDPSRLEAFRSDAHRRDLEFWCWVQYHLYRQLSTAVEHVHSHGLALLVELPVGVNPDSAEAWNHPGLFRHGSVLGLPPGNSSLRGRVLESAVIDWEAMAADDHQWWEDRFRSIRRYADGYRIDHISHLFRAWVVPDDAVDGLLGTFRPCKPLTRAEVEDYLPHLDLDSLVRPLIDGEVLERRFGGFAEAVRERCFTSEGTGLSFIPSLASQRDVLEVSGSGGLDGLGNREVVTRQLLDMRADVTLLEVEGGYHPRVSWQATEGYQRLANPEKTAFDAMANDFYHHRHTGVWRAHGMHNLPPTVDLTPLLPIGHDSGDVPAMVPDLLAELGVLQLAVELGPTGDGRWRADPLKVEYLSMTAPSSPDGVPMADWWKGDRISAERYWREVMGRSDPVPDQLPGEVLGHVIETHLSSPAMLAMFRLEDLLAMDAPGDSVMRAGTDRKALGAIHPPVRDWRRRPVQGNS